MDNNSYGGFVDEGDISSRLNNLKIELEAEKANYAQINTFRTKLEQKYNTDKLKSLKDIFDKTVKMNGTTSYEIHNEWLKIETKLTSLKAANQQKLTQLELNKLRLLAKDDELLTEENISRRLNLELAADEERLKQKAIALRGEADIQAELDLQREQNKSALAELTYQRQLNQARSVADYELDLELAQSKKVFEIEKKAKDRSLKYQRTMRKKLAKEEAEYAKTHSEEELAKWKEEKEKELQEKADKLEKAAASKAMRAERATELIDDIFGKDLTMAERFEGLKNIGKDDEGNFNSKMLLNNLATLTASLTQLLDKNIEEVAVLRGQADTRLQGSDTNWLKIGWDLGIGGASSALFRRSEIDQRALEFVNQGIAFNVAQRAYLSKMSEKVATTFNATNSTLLRLVRIQQQDTTAARLGMESALNSFLNNMYETTEYMGSIAESIKGNLEEAMALMEARVAVEFEYEVQKWMGSMYSVGMSQSTVQGISDALGKMVAGDISGLTGEGASNLIIMAANEAGLSIGNMLNEGLSANDTNMLLRSVVTYLADMYAMSQDSRVVQQQLAGVFGVAASDLKAAATLALDSDWQIGGVLDEVTNSNLKYDSAIDQLMKMASTAMFRTSVGEMMTNAWENFQYTMASSMASNPVLYGIYKASGLLEQTTGGIAIPSISVMGNGIDLNTTVADLMAVGAMSGAILQGIPSLVMGLVSTAAPSAGLAAMGIRKNNDVKNSLFKVFEEYTINQGTEGKAPGLKVQKKTKNTAGEEVSESGAITLVANSSSEDIENASMANAESEANEKAVEAKAEEETDIKLEHVNDSIKLIYDLLVEATEGTKTFKVSQTLDLGAFN